MSSLNSTVGGSIYAEILNWSIGLDDWQRDGLRRIVENGTITEVDLNELATACCHANGLLEDVPPKLEPLQAKHIPSGRQNDGTVTLSSVAETENVNVLCSKQELPFAAKGLTVVFGYNGSGKSGYGRILRRACRARSKGVPILSNVLDDDTSDPASAIITYRLNDVEQPAEHWVDEQKVIDPLSSISIFDAECASVHVREKNDVAFTPLGLDILPLFGQACKAIQKKLDAQKKALEGEAPKLLKSQNANGPTKVGVALRALNAATLPEELDKLGSLTQKELQRLKDIQVQLASDPRKTAQNLRTQAGRIESLRKTIAAASKALSEDSIATIKALAADETTKSKAAQIAAAVSFADDPLTEIGEPVWWELWEAARRYSTVAIPNDPFPVTRGDNAVCVLCQQSLDEDAKDRLVRFEEFVCDDSAQKAEAAKETLRTAIVTLRNLGLRDNALREQIKDVEACDRLISVSVRKQIATLLRRFRAIHKAYSSGHWEFAIPGHLKDVDSELVLLISKLNSKAADAEKSVDADQRKELETELLELQAREWLASVLGDVKEHVHRLGQIAVIEKAIKTTRTNGVTAKSKDLSKKYVTDQLRDAFADEIKKMQRGVRRLNVELTQTAGEYGSSYYRVQLVGASKTDIGRVLSEGEHRCIALAGFLSELATDPNKSAIVFDDPVTSLDHHWRECFSKRLVDEAVDRQVIVFTHDIVFLMDLMHGAKDQGVPVQVQHVTARKAKVGIVEDGLPWDGKSVADRIDKLEKEVRAAKPFYNDSNDEEYKQRIEGVYSKLRATVEKAVEEHFFYRIVVRQRDYINLTDLRKTVAITNSHCRRVNSLFDKCSDITNAHHRSSSRSFSVPTPAEALADLAELKNVVDDLKQEQRKVT